MEPAFSHHRILLQSLMLDARFGKMENATNVVISGHSTPMEPAFPSTINARLTTPLMENA
jgi:hypothetical protein